MELPTLNPLEEKLAQMMTEASLRIRGLVKMIPPVCPDTYGEYLVDMFDLDETGQDDLETISGAAVYYLGQQINEPFETVEEAREQLMQNAARGFTQEDVDEKAGTASLISQTNPNFFAEHIAPVIMFGLLMRAGIHQEISSDEMLENDLLDDNTNVSDVRLALAIGGIQRHVMFRYYFERAYGIPPVKFKPVRRNRDS